MSPGNSDSVTLRSTEETIDEKTHQPCQLSKATTLEEATAGSKLPSDDTKGDGTAEASQGEEIHFVTGVRFVLLFSGMMLTLVSSTD